VDRSGATQPGQLQGLRPYGTNRNKVTYHAIFYVPTATLRYQPGSLVLEKSMKDQYDNKEQIKSAYFMESRSCTGSDYFVTLIFYCRTNYHRRPSR
jgi:hypothetical protein